MKLLTIITVNYNNAEGLKRTFRSIMPQLSERVDYVVIDGGSTDDSVSLIETEAPKLHFFCSEPDGGIYQGMNKGVSHSDGRYLLFINSGDELCPGIIKAVLPLLERNEADILYGDIRIINSITKKAHIDRFPNNLTVSFLYECYVPHPGSFIRRQLLIEMPYNENLRIIADYEFFVKAIMQNGCTTMHIPKVISNFYSGGISESHVEEHKRERTEVVDRLFPPLISEVAKLSKKFQAMGCYTEIMELSETRKLHKRVKPLLRAILKLNNLFHSEK